MRTETGQHKLEWDEPSELVLGRERCWRDCTGYSLHRLLCRLCETAFTCVCVRCTRYPDGFITQSSATFFRLVAGPSGRRFEEFAITRAFPEVGAFFAGLDSEWPPVL